MKNKHSLSRADILAYIGDLTAQLRELALAHDLHESAQHLEAAQRSALRQVIQDIEQTRSSHRAL